MCVNTYHNISRNFPHLWMIENNATYWGWIIDDDAKPAFKSEVFYENNIKGKGAMGTDFGNYYNGAPKMGDSPSVTYLLSGNPNEPDGESWGGRFTKLPYSAFRDFDRNTTLTDTVPVYSVITLTLNAGTQISKDENQEIWIKIDGQWISGFYAGDGIFKVRFVPKRIGNWKYVVNCSSKSLQGLTGEFVSVNPWPGIENTENVKLNNWWSDRLETELYIGQYQGAETVAKWRETFLSYWAKRFEWIAE